MVRRWFTRSSLHRQHAASGGAKPPRSQHPAWRWIQHRRQERRRGHRLFRPQTSEGRESPRHRREQRLCVGPASVAPVNEADTVLLPDGLIALKRVARLTGMKIDGSYLNLDGGFESKRNRKAVFNAGLVPTIKENPRNRKTPKRGRKRLFNAAIHSLRLCVERTFAWEDKFKRLLLRFEFKQQRHYGMKLMAYTLINLRHFCGA